MKHKRRDRQVGRGRETDRHTDRQTKTDRQPGTARRRHNTETETDSVKRGHPI